MPADSAPREPADARAAAGRRQHLHDVDHAGRPDQRVAEADHGARQQQRCEHVRRRAEDAADAGDEHAGGHHAGGPDAVGEPPRRQAAGAVGERERRDQGAGLGVAVADLVDEGRDQRRHREDAHVRQPDRRTRQQQPAPPRGRRHVVPHASSRPGLRGDHEAAGPSAQRAWSYAAPPAKRDVGGSDADPRGQPEHERGDDARHRRAGGALRPAGHRHRDRAAPWGPRSIEGHYEEHVAAVATLEAVDARRRLRRRRHRVLRRPRGCTRRARSRRCPSSASRRRRC